MDHDPRELADEQPQVTTVKFGLKNTPVGRSEVGRACRRSRGDQQVAGPGGRENGLVRPGA
ncbi:hypothetical protein ABZ747_15940 [Kitasatospora cineracea]|uniref:hypothetical protein n=1 Tax=Kitasatospora cineracea TaxID=88074 RepID=UPI0033DF6A50